VSTVRRQLSSSLHNTVVLAVLCLFAAVSSFAGVGQRSTPAGASAGSPQDHAITRSDRASSMQVVVRKHAELNAGGFPPVLQAASETAPPATGCVSLLAPPESSAAVPRQRSITSAQPRAPPVEASVRA
jgi:hypothetical protein